MKKLMAASCVVLLSSVAIATPSKHSYNHNEIFSSVQTGQIEELSLQEKNETEGEVAPLIYLAVVVAGRVVVKRGITLTARQAARHMARGGSVYVKNSRSAKSLAKNAYGRKNILRHGPRGHKRNPVTYSHYQSRRGAGHAFYGRSYR